MIKFQTWLEIVDPIKPFGKVRKSKFIKNQGTNTARPAIRYSWTTKLGNIVTLHFIQKDQDAYEVIFYVNNTMYDDAATNQENGRDPEILSGIIYLIKDRADRIGANKLEFEAYHSDADTKILRGIDSNLYKYKALLELNKFHKIVQAYEPKLIPPTQIKIDLWKRLGRGDPKPLYDISKDMWIRSIRNTEEAIKNNSRIADFIDSLKINDFNFLNYDISNLIEVLTNFDNALESNSEQGLRRVKNRRAAIYSKLIDRIMTNDWNIERYGNRFYLTRK